jgi:hypothetical protein
VSNGKLRDKVRVHGEVESHPEGYYYIEWWQDGRKREQIKNRAEVVDRARRKAIELQANRAGIETVGKPRGQSEGNGAAVFIAAVGETLPGHYHAVRIGRASVEFEDMSTGVAASPAMKIQGPLSKRV